MQPGNSNHNGTVAKVLCIDLSIYLTLSLSFSLSRMPSSTNCLWANGFAKYKICALQENKIENSAYNLSVVRLRGNSVLCNTVVTLWSRTKWSVHNAEYNCNSEHTAAQQIIINYWTAKNYGVRRSYAEHRIISIDIFAPMWALSIQLRLYLSRQPALTARTAFKRSCIRIRKRCHLTPTSVARHFFLKQPPVYLDQIISISIGRDLYCDTHVAGLWRMQWDDVLSVGETLKTYAIWWRTFHQTAN